MDAAEILSRIKSLETAEMEPEEVAEIYAHALSLMTGYITETDLRRLILLGAAMYRNSTRDGRAELQIPQTATTDSDALGASGHLKGLLH